MRLQLISKEKQDIIFNCPNPDCQTKLEGCLIINYNKFKNYKSNYKTKIKSLVDKSAEFKGFTKNFHESLNFQMTRGESISNEFNSGDYFLEYSDGIPVSKASTVVHDKWTPILRESPKKITDSSYIDAIRTLHTEELWSDLSDLIKSYQIFNTNNIRVIIERIQNSSELLKGKQFDFSSELGFVNAYFTVLNFFMFSWIDFEKHTNYIEFIFNFMFSEDGLKNEEINHLSLEYTENNFLLKFNEECSLLILRFIQLRKIFKNTYQNIEFKESVVSNPDFTTIKTFYTDCFEFLGRYSIIPLKMMNLIERGSSEIMPPNIPRNITNTEDFKNMDHGKKLEILDKCSTNIILEIFSNRFDSKLRNGINHNKTSFNHNNQIISYFPITKRPNEEFQIQYDEFLLKTLNIYESVLRINQFIKMFHYYNRDKTI